MSLKGEFGNMCVYMQHDRSRTATTAYVYMHVRELQPLSEIDVLGSRPVRMRLTLANSRYMHVALRPLVSHGTAGTCMCMGL